MALVVGCQEPTLPSIGNTEELSFHFLNSDGAQVAFPQSRHLPNRPVVTGCTVLSERPASLQFHRPATALLHWLYSGYAVSNHPTGGPRLFVLLE